MNQNTFYQRFIQQKNEISEEIAKITDISQKTPVLVRIAQLSDECRLNRNILSARDLQTYTNDIQELTNQLDSKISSLPKKKFSFARKINPSGSSVSEHAVNPVSTNSSTNSGTNSGDFMHNHSIKDTADFANITDATLEPALTTELINIHALRRTKLILRGSVLKSVTLLDLQDCFVYIEQVQGPLYITKAKNCTFIVNCHQFRMHQSSDCAIYISCGSKRPIIEACSGLKFAQFPQNLATNNIELTQWEHIDDFNWIRKEQSINWTPIDSVTGVNLTQSLDQLLKLSEKS